MPANTTVSASRCPSCTGSRVSATTSCSSFSYTRWVYFRFCLRTYVCSVLTGRRAQRWIYRIDPKRVNEYGQVLATDVDKAGETKKDAAGETKKTR